MKREPDMADILILPVHMPAASERELRGPARIYDLHAERLRRIPVGVAEAFDMFGDWCGYWGLGLA
jgi:hypothetical protein